METVKIELELPKYALESVKVRKEGAANEFKKIIALELFREGVVSLGKAAEIAGMCIVDFMDLSALKNIPLHYRKKDLVSDLKWAKKK